uniref:Uncharacterized protein n=1 Tax=Cacopsylla melanoneura TaxID=428564 RepID=A0A8D8XX40_9HEMI
MRSKSPSSIELLPSIYSIPFLLVFTFFVVWISKIWPLITFSPNNVLSFLWNTYDHKTYQVLCFYIILDTRVTISPHFVYICAICTSTNYCCVINLATFHTRFMGDAITSVVFFFNNFLHETK